MLYWWKNSTGALAALKQSRGNKNGGSLDHVRVGRGLLKPGRTQPGTGARTAPSANKYTRKQHWTVSVTLNLNYTYIYIISTCARVNIKQILWTSWKLPWDSNRHALQLATKMKNCTNKNIRHAAGYVKFAAKYKKNLRRWTKPIRQKHTAGEIAPAIEQTCQQNNGVLAAVHARRASSSSAPFSFSSARIARAPNSYAQ